MIDGPSTASEPVQTVTSLRSSTRPLRSDVCKGARLEGREKRLASARGAIDGDDAVAHRGAHREVSEVDPRERGAIGPKHEVVLPPLRRGADLRIRPPQHEPMRPADIRELDPNGEPGGLELVQVDELRRRPQDICRVGVAGLQLKPSRAPGALSTLIR